MAPSNFDANRAQALPARGIIFGRLRTEIARLREIEKSWCQITEFCPRVDTQIYMNSTRSELGGGEDEDNGYNQKEVFLDKWPYLDEDDNDIETEAGVIPEGLL
jgi:hypothetical protein